MHELLFYTVFMLWFVSGWAFLWFIALGRSDRGSAAFWGYYWVGTLPLEHAESRFMLGVSAAWLYARPSLRFYPGILIAGGNSCHCHAVDVVCGSPCWASLGVGLRFGRADVWHGTLGASATHRLPGRFDMTWPLALLWGVGLSLVFGYLYFL